MMRDLLVLLLRERRGDLSVTERGELERRLAADPEARAWRDWIDALGRAGTHASAEADPTPHAAQPDAVEIAALAEGRLQGERARTVLAALLATPHGAELLEAAIEEQRTVPVPAARPPTAWRRLLPSAAAAVVLLGSAWLWLQRDTSGGNDLLALVHREPLAISSLRSG